MNTVKRLVCRRWLSLVGVCIPAVAAVHAAPATLSGAQLLAALHQGGYVLVMRHANSPFTPPDKSTAEPDNVQLERQLDETGRTTAQAMGEAIQRLHIPVGEILSSPTYRALETLRLASLGKAQTVSELDEPAQGMQANADATRSAWLRRKVAERPRRGTDTLIVTHTPNIMSTFGQSAAGIAAGETLVFRPDGHGTADLVARIKIEEWPRLEMPK